MLCVDCKQEFEENIEEKELKVTLDNPGNISIKGNVMVCPHCKQQYATEEDALNIMASFEQQRIRR